MQCLFLFGTLQNIGHKITDFWKSKGNQRSAEIDIDIMRFFLQKSALLLSEIVGGLENTFEAQF